MIAILENPAIRERALPLSVENYHWMIANDLVPRRAELIRGVIVEKMSKSSLHSLLAKRLYDHLLRALGPGWLVRKEDPLTLADSEPEPDVSVVQGQENDFRHSHPRTAALVVEIAVSSAAADRAMIPAYAEAGVLEYWLLLAKKQEIECHTHPSGGLYRKVSRLSLPDTVTSAVLPGVSFTLASLFQ